MLKLRTKAYSLRMNSSYQIQRNC